MAESVSLSHHSPHSADVFWRVLGAFAEIDWLVGAGNYQVGEHEGRQARILAMETPIIEFLLSRDDDRRELRYGVVKNPFVPVDNYRATVTVASDEDGCRVTFSSTFDLDATPLEQVSQMLTAAYRMMANQIDQNIG